nr:MAG TPA: hypothetical protein [Caudoviricetes sp.]DAN29908.1 MAG TPA: hypothetical protein [Caudoviricetes sp.]
MKYQSFLFTSFLNLSMKKAFLYETLDFLLNCGIIINEKGRLR